MSELEHENENPIPIPIPHRATSILVIGAGELGTAILAALTSHPQYDPSRTKVALALRPTTLGNPTPEKRAQQDRFRSQAIDLVAADLEAWSEDELVTMLRAGGYTTVLHAGGFGAASGTMTKLTRAVLRAAASASAHNSETEMASAKGNEHRNEGENGNGNVEFYVPWQFGADYDTITRAGGQGMFSEQLDVRDLLRSQGKVDWVIVSCGIFMSFLFEEFWGVVQRRREGVSHRKADVAVEPQQGDQPAKEQVLILSPGETAQTAQTDTEGGGAGAGAGAGARKNSDSTQPSIQITALNSWDDWITTTTATDIAKCTASILYSPDPHPHTPINQPVYIAGDTLTYGEFADTIARATGRSVTRRVWPLEYLREESREDPEDQLKRYRVVFAEGRGVSWPKEETWSAEAGIEMETVEEWARKNLT
ncbi:hypothetical protein A1O3_00276 [Capronia epimyces CBS 606.96]|uniref:NmrA-like domain-containing protein n=1 Tax=Capronia epimyces CBS 606.96 TaxID=1182542 RepID=W9YR31_9EURO|nr:uncharacterized protein A1O3_00276 [Capronia epimyces CBS 606.96]EXJ91726.1 hypothetical protein A1O3_00276 [Capronia epimyces CBS 606.96]